MELDVRHIDLSMGEGKRARTVLGDVSFSVPDGAFCSLLGESGAGKSTILKVIAGILLQDGGSVLFDGQDIVALDENAAQQLHPAVEQRNFSQLFLGEDAVGLIEAGQQQRDVIIAAVVRHKDAGAILRDVVQSLDAEPDAGDVQDAFAPMGDVLFYQLAHRLGVACGQRTLGFAQHTVMDDHVPEQINE